MTRAVALAVNLVLGGAAVRAAADWPAGYASVIAADVQGVRVHEMSMPRQTSGHILNA